MNFKIEDDEQENSACSLSCKVYWNTDLGNNGDWNCWMKLWWKRLISPDCCSSLTAGGQPDIPCYPVLLTGNTEHRLEHSPDEKLNQKVIKPLDQLQLIVNIRDRFTFRVKTQSTKTRMLTILQGRKMAQFLYQLNSMTHSHKKECIWLSSNEVDGPRAFNTEWSKSERE